MRSTNQPFIEVHLTPEQQEKEEAYYRQLCHAESEVVRDMLAQTSTPDALQAVIENASRFAEAKTQRDRPPNIPPVACKEGCCWCCYQAVRVTAPEAFRITRFLATEPAETRNSIVQRLRKLDKKTRDRSSKARYKLRLPCAFLTDNQCSVYSVRPLACAEFTSFDIQDCKRGQRVGFKNVIYDKLRKVIYYAVQEGLANGLKEALPKADSAPLELTAAVLCALDSTDAAESWIAGENIFARAHLTVDPK